MPDPCVFHALCYDRPVQVCGIAGVFNRDGRPVEQAWLLAMADTLCHRGPDADGFWAADGLGLAHRRLSVIDVSAAGRQPMGSEDGRIQVCYNGEIYNFDEIRQELMARGHRFVSRTDTEVIAHAWEEWGAQAMGRFNGMFAFAVWDRAERRLWLVRDRLGVKPLYYAAIGTRLVFGSEIKALLAVPGVTRTLDPVALDAFLALNYVPGPRTIWREVEQLPPGHLLTAVADGYTVEPYWDVRFGARPADRPTTGHRRDPPPVRRRGASAPRVGRAARRVPQRRARLVGRRALHAATAHRCPAHLQRPLRRAVLR